MTFAFAGLYTDTITYPNGAAAASIPVTIFQPGTQTLAALFTDRTMALPATNPVTSSALGNLSFYTLPGEYDIWVAGVYAFTVLVGIDPADSVAGSSGASAGADLTGATNTLVTSTHLGSPLPIAQGGTGSAIQNFVDLTADQTVAGIKTHTSVVRGITPVGANDFVTKGYSDANVSTLQPKTAAKLGTVAALSPANTYSAGVLTATGNGVLTVDGVAVALNDRVLVKNEAAGANDGLYSCTTAGTVSVPYVLTRTTDMDSGGEVPGAQVLVTAGTQAGNQFTVTNAGPYTLGTTAITWVQTGQGASYSAGAGITIAGSVISVTAGSIPTAELPLTVGVIAQLSERSFSDGVITSTTTLTSASAAFTSGDTGKTVVGANIPAGTTLTYSSATVCTLSQACTNGTSLVCTIAQGVYSLRSVYTTDATRNVTWRGCLAPTAGGGYMSAGVDDYLSTA